MSGNEKCRMYKETQSSIRKQLEKGVKLDENIYLSQIVSIKKDVGNTDENVRKTAIEMLNFLLRLNIEEVEAELIKILYDNTVNKFLQNSILKSIKQKVVDTISENKYNFINVISPWKNTNTNKLINIIEDVCISDLPKDKCKAFFIKTIIPTMMATNTDNQIRDALIDISFMMSTILPISDLSVDELDAFLKDVNSRYVVNIGELRDKDYPNWHNMWIFLVRFCDKHIHYSMDLTNKLLRVVEFAFRNSSIQQRLKGYDCWKELIDNASLDMNHMCSAKQIKLLITPLKAKFSKQEIVICKRFDVFTYLLEKLQHKAVLCLTEFFEFCFGPVGDSKDPSKTGQGRSVPQIWTKSTKVLIEIIGHSHGKTMSCLSTEDVIKLEKPVIDYTNISSSYKVIINSVGECCALLKEIDIQSKRETVIKCLWKSVFNLILPTTEGNRKKYFQLISTVLDNYLTQSRENPYFEDLLILIFSALMSYDEEIVYEAIQYILKQLLTILFTIDDFPSSVTDKFKVVLTLWFSKIFMVESKLTVFKEIMMVFAKLKPQDENVTHVGKVWLCLANEMVADLTLEQIELFDDFNNFFMWPSQHLHHLDEVTKKQTVLHWMKLYRKITADAESKKLNVMKELRNVFKSNPLLNPNVVSLLNVMSQFETKFTKEFVNNMMTVSSQILQLPNLKLEEQQKISALVMQYFEPSLECYTGEINDDLIKNICACIQYILCIHKDYKLLDTLSAFMKNSSPKLRSKFSKHLSPLFLDLFNNESDTSSYNAKELQKALQGLSVENPKKDDSFVQPIGRSARIANMAKNSPKSPHKRRKAIEPSPTGLRLFGKDLDTLSPLQVKGSQLNNSTPKSRKLANTLKSTPRSSLSINEEKSSDFVPIDTEVKFQPDKLSRHQKEVLKRRREDIPALYQDLSQSLSQDMFSSSSSSKGLEKVPQETPGDKRKVIVEVISDVFPVDKKNEASPQDPPETVPKAPDVNVPNSFSDAALSSEIIPEAPVQTIGDVNVPNTDLSFEANLFPDAMLPSEIIAEEAIQAIKELTAPNKDTNTLFPQTLETHKMSEPEEAVIQEEKDTISESSAAESKSKEVEKVKLIEDVLEPKIEKEPYQIEVVEEKDSVKSEAEEKEKRRKQKIELELQKLRMDIVGAEEFIAASRRTRTREKPKKLEDIPTKKPKTAPKEEKLSPQRIHSSRKSLNSDVEVKDLTTEKNRRKSIGSIQETKPSVAGEDNSTISPTKDKFNKPHDPETPKSRCRKPLKIRLDDSKTKSSVDTKQTEDFENTPKNRGKQRKVTVKDETTDSKGEERGVKRKHSTTIDEESEDIIESSQEFHTVLTPVFNTSKRRSITEISKDEQKLDRSEERTMVQQKTVTKEDFFEVLPNIDQDISHIEGNFEVTTTATPEVEEQRIEDLDVNKEQMEIKSNDQVNTSQDTTVTQDSSQDRTQSEDDPENQTGDLEPEPMCTQDTATQDTCTPSQFSAVSEDARPPVLYFDLPKKPELTESERMMCKMDTMSMCMDPRNLKILTETFVEETEIKCVSPTDQKQSVEMDDVLSTPNSKSSSSLPSSPVTVDTPNRTSELLSNTLDISPINSKSSSDDGEPEDNVVPISINFKAEMEELDKIEKEKILELMLEKKEEGMHVLEEQEKQLANLNENGEIPVLLGDILTELEAIPNEAEGDLHQDDVAEKIEGISYQPEENFEQVNVVSSENFEDEQVENIVGVADSTQSEIENQNHPETAVRQVEDVTPKKQEGVRHAKDTSIQERASRLLNMVNVSSTQKMYIKKRSVTMSPSTARIKKLMSNFNQKTISEGAVAAVREEDLLTFTREVPSPLALPRSSILKRKISDTSESEGISPCPKRKRVNFSDPCLTSKKLFIKDDYNREAATNLVFDEPPAAKPEEEPCQVSSLTEESPSSEMLTETENVETEPTLEMVNPLMLKRDKPIYPKLVDCNENVILILKRVTSPMFITTLMNKLKSKEIKTIGDLAKQSEAEINRFPFKVPVVPNVYKALDNYYKKNIDKFVKEDSKEMPKVNGLEEGKRQGVIKRTSPKKVDLKVEFRQIIEKSKVEGTFENLLKTLLCSVEKQQLLSLVKTQCKLEINDLLPDTDFKVAIKHITQKLGLPNALRMLTNSIETPEEESVYYDCITKQSLEKRSLSDIWETRTLTDIRNGLQESIDRNVFNRQDVVGQCLLPLIENPSDVSSYITRLTVVQLSEIVVQRLESADLSEFFSRILGSYPASDCKALTRDMLVRVESPGEVVGLFRDCIGAQSEDDQQAIMVEMFKYISGKLSVNTLLGLHVDFLKRVSSLPATSEK